MVEYAYDALGRRVQKIDPTGAQPVTTRFYYDGQNVLLETDENTVVQRYYVNGPTYIDERILIHDVPTEAEHYYLLKELYSIAGLANTNGALVEAYAYDAYGKVQIFAFGDSSFDSDGDGDVDLVDYAAFRNCLTGPASVVAGDHDHDGDVDLDDFAAWVVCLAGPQIAPPGDCPWSDLASDGDVDLADFGVFAGRFTGAEDGGDLPGACAAFDSDADDDVDLADFARFTICFAGPDTPATCPTPLDHSQFDNPYHFTGRRLDLVDTGGPEPKQVYHYRARPYRPLHGRFPQRDPGGYVDGMNLYEYVRSNPTALADSSGQQAGIVAPNPTATGRWKGLIEAPEWYWSTVMVAKFLPSSAIIKDACCKEIQAVHTVRSKWDSKSPLTGIRDWWEWHLDQGQPWFPASNTWNIESPTFPMDTRDEPGYKRTWDGGFYGQPSLIRQEFEICAVCKQGAYKGKYKILSCIRWKHSFKPNEDPFRVTVTNINGMIDAVLYDVQRWASIGRPRTGDAQGRSSVWYSRSMLPPVEPLPGYESTDNTVDPSWEISGPGHGPTAAFRGLVEPFLNN